MSPQTAQPCHPPARSAAAGAGRIRSAVRVQSAFDSGRPDCCCRKPRARGLQHSVKSLSRVRNRVLRSRPHAMQVKPVDPRRDARNGLAAARQACPSRNAFRIVLSTCTLRTDRVGRIESHVEADSDATFAPGRVLWDIQIERSTRTRPPFNSSSSASSVSSVAVISGRLRVCACAHRTIRRSHRIFADRA